MLRELAPKTKRLFTHLSDWIFLPKCAACAAEVGMHETLCEACWTSLKFISAPCCPSCSHPFELSSHSTATLCGHCIQNIPELARARAAMYYDDASRPLIASFKYADKTQLTGILGRFMQQADTAIFGDVDVVMPVPLHTYRLIGRRYNQAVLLARYIAAGRALTLDVATLLKHKRTQTQAGQTRAERLKNIRGSFSVNRRREQHVKGKVILLVDDVMTTMATLNECARILKKSGAAEVRALTLAKTVLQ